MHSSCSEVSVLWRFLNETVHGSEGVPFERDFFHNVDGKRGTKLVRSSCSEVIFLKDLPLA